jgi:hypothetical protein
MKSDEADATISHLLDYSPETRVEDHFTYYRVESDAGLSVDLAEVSAYLGRELTMSSFLITLSAYVGEVSIEGDVVTFQSGQPGGDRD